MNYVVKVLIDVEAESKDEVIDWVLDEMNVTDLRFEIASVSDPSEQLS